MRTEEEQLQALKGWWQENGKSLVLGVGLAVALVLGWQGWQARQEQQAATASALYQNLTEAIRLQQASGAADEGQAATARHLAEQLKTDFTKASYARYAALMLAAVEVKQGEYDAALAELDWLLADAENTDSLVRVATLRKAAVLQQQGKADQGVTLLEALDAGSYEAEKQELLGDLYLSQGKPVEARQAYDAALVAAGGESNRPLIKIKRDDLAGVNS
ncbi:tetratricopeptide repeat protein [Marinobacterium sp. A346]|uniref:Tetratricopeptide repeat protein n=1 Tax=Marinobacterium weihaiense TaxID=2851016 RepID=A0ABS6ME13_9GAMM|nr:tetratricopeptide repeat protein [Marinobacterium weihaiense]